MPLIVFLHGVGETPQTWQDQVAVLPPDTKAVAPWLRGLRPARDETFSVTDAADDVLGLLNVHGVEQFTLVGSSLGAVVALDISTRAPETVSHLVLSAGIVHPPAMLMRAQKLVLSMAPKRRLAAMGIDKAKFLQAMDVAASIDYRNRLDSETARTLVLVGEADKPNRPAAEQLAAGIAGARLEVVPGAGHRVNVDRPQVFNDLVFGFLAEPAPADDAG